MQTSSEPNPPSTPPQWPAAPLAPLADVESLIDASMPRRKMGRFWLLAGLFALAVFGGMVISDEPTEVAGAVRVLMSLLMLGLIVAMGAMTWFSVRAVRQEQKQVSATEELVQLRRWPEAVTSLQMLLSQPMRMPPARIMVLILLTQVLARYARFEDAIKVQNYLLDTVGFDPSTAQAIKLGRAMAMLREDHLFDADRAIADLRRTGARSAERPSVDNASSDAPEFDGAPIEMISRSHQSAGLALLELYRDVKTGHPAEAIELFNARLLILQEQLGGRVADAYALVARAHDLLGDERAARSNYERATLLSPSSELGRRYPEVAALSSRYRATETPPELRAGWEAA